MDYTDMGGLTKRERLMAERIIDLGGMVNDLMESLAEVHPPEANPGCRCAACGTRNTVLAWSAELSAAVEEYRGQKGN